MTLKTHAKKPTILVMGDQINRNISSLVGQSPSTARILMVEIEKKFDCVCFSSNQVLIWNMLRLANVEHSLIGLGKLFSDI